MSMNAAIRRVTLKNSVHPLPHGSIVKGPSSPGRMIRLTLAVRTRAALPDLSALDRVKADSRSYLTRQDLADRYGSDPDSVAAVTAFAQANHLVVTRNDAISGHIGLAGTVADISTAFGVQLFDYDHPTLGRFHARTGAIQLPASLDGHVLGVFGLNNHRVLHRSLRRGGVELSDASKAARTRPWFLPTELVSIYDFPAADASRQCIGLLEFGGGVSTDDVAAYFKQIGAAAPVVEVIPVDGVSVDPAADPDSTGEVMLDIDVAGAMSGGAKLAVYFSTFDEKGLVDCLGAVLQDAANDPGVLSISWGWAELEPFNNSGITWSQAAIDDCNRSFLAAANLGITVCVSTGDDGAEAQIKDGRAHANYPAASPYVLAVGGTTLHATKAADGSVQRTEVTWNDGPGSGTGGGVSESMPVPAWQEGKVVASVNPGHFAGRAIPDVSANADPATGYLVMSGGKLQVVGGTSASAPLWASLVTRINAIKGKRVGNFNAQLYASIGPSNVLNDVTQGNNDTDGLLHGNYPAGPGWDACTGWGTPGGTALSKAL